MVDDEQAVLSAVERVIGSRSDLDLEVTATSDSAHAAELFRSGEEFDLLITDLRMNPLDGMELMDIAFEANPEIRVVVVSAYLNEDAVGKIRSKGCSAYVRKPFRMAEIFDAIDSALA